VNQGTGFFVAVSCYSGVMFSKNSSKASLVPSLCPSPVVPILSFFCLVFLVGVLDFFFPSSPRFRGSAEAGERKGEGGKGGERNGVGESGGGGGGQGERLVDVLRYL